jgi:acetoin utilization protein AcuB
MERLKLPVEEFTTPDPVTASVTDSLGKLKELMQVHGIRHLPIMEKNKVVGIVSERDLRVIANLQFGPNHPISAGDIMATDPVTVDAQTPLDKVAFEMSSKKIGSVIVNEGNEFVGIFTSTDALNALIEITRSDYAEDQVD